MITMDIFTTSL